MNILQFPMDRTNLLRLVMGLLALIGLALAVPAPAQTAPRKVALIIGNANYVSMGGLPNPGNDADLVAEAARRAGFQSVVVAKDLGLPAFRKALNDFQAQVVGADVAMVYYAGHGIERQGKNYLVPTDVALRDPSELQVEAIPLDYVLDKLMGAKRIVVLLDACRDNPLKETWSARGTVAGNGLGLVQPPDSSLVIFAAQPGVIAVDGEGVNSNFAVALAKYLPQPDLPLKDLGGAVQDSVYTASSKFQKPYIINNLGVDSFVLVPGIRSAPVVALPSILEDWDAAKQEDTIEAYTDFMKKYPDSRYDKVAQALLEIAIGKNRHRPGAGAGAAPAVLTQAQPQPVVVAPPAPQPEQSPQGSSQVSAPADVPVVTTQPAPQPQVQPAYPTPVTPPPCGSGGTTCYNLPQIPPPPVFARGSYPVCKDDWKAIKDPVQAVTSVNTCLTAYFTYKSTTLDKFLSDLAAYQEVINGLNLQVQGTGKPYTVEAQKQFFNEAQRLFREQQAGGSLRKLHEATGIEWERDVVYLKDSYNRSTGCGGYPTPSGLAKTTYCPYN